VVDESSETMRGAMHCDAGAARRDGVGVLVDSVGDELVPL
jgi:hypothetical protein